MRQTVDFGIDLGTTNSVIARALQGGIKIVKNRWQSEITQSAVARTSSGQTLVGQDALEKADLDPAVRFKRLMGTAHLLGMHDRAELSPEELSAEVLKELKAAVQLRYDEILDHVVITVPAMFQQPQCEATHRAAELAGLKPVALIQEPIAAATAYISDNPEEGDYMVYDLGGGTFDVSIVRLRGGEMSVVAHGGDNYLGGSDFDTRIREWTIEQIHRRLGSSPDFSAPGNSHRLQKACEAAKIALSIPGKDETQIDLGDLGLAIAQIPITRQIFEDLIDEYVGRTIKLAEERLNQAKLTPSDITRLLMVGGSTMIPCVRRRLRDELDIPLSFEQDPMTVVACGAAIHASSILKPDRGRSGMRVSQSSLVMQLSYEPVAPDLMTAVAGNIISPEGFSGEIRLSSSSGDWDSGWIALNEGGAFACDVKLRKGLDTEFRLSARDFQGNLWPVDPATISIRNGVSAAPPATPYKYGVAKANGELGLVLDYNQALPAHGRHDFRAAKTIPATSPEELAIYFLEGQSDTARDNIKVGELRILGTDLKRTIRQGDAVEIRIQMDESRRVKARVFIPLHDLEYVVDLATMMETPPVEDVLASISELRESLSDINDIVSDEDSGTVISAHRDIEQLEAEVDRLGAGELGQAERVAHRLAEAKSKTRPLQVKYGVQIKHREAIENIGRAEKVAGQQGDSMGLATVEDLRKEANRCLRLEDEKGLTSVDDRAMQLFWQHYLKTEECWIGFVEFLREQRRFASQPIAYDEYLKRAEGCLDRRDFEGTRLNGLQAMSYLPSTQAKQNRFWDAGLQ